jgi:type VI secretion system (T6SS) phospholipase Tle1-like effector
MGLYAFDGSDADDSHAGTDAQSVAGDTNIFRFFSAYYANAPKQETAKYVPGVGTRFSVIGKALGGAFGLGWNPRIAETYDALCANYIAGDEDIDVIGFSRGAAMALDFANKVTAHGIQGHNGVVVPKPAIRFVGLFDVVDAFGIANLGGPASMFDPIHHLALPSTVQHCYHAMALDERRPSFVNHRVDGGYEVWFRGVHSDIGGGNNNPGLEYVTLRWMFRKAMLCGLPIIEANITDSAIHPELEIKPNPLSKASFFWRTVRPFDRLHYAVDQHKPLPGEPLNEKIPPGCPRESADDEKNRVTAPTAAPVTT